MSEEKIIRIEECTFKKDKYISYDGYQVITDKQTIKFGISNGQACCETWGYLATNDDLSDFDGAVLRSINIVDELLNVKKFEELELYEPDTFFVNFETDKGTMQFVAYNSHNGYYGHEVVIISDQLNASDVL